MYFKCYHYLFRLVRFDATGRSLITGITNFPTAPSPNPVHHSAGGVLNPTATRPTINLLRGLGDLDLDPDIQEELEERQDRFQESYRQLVTHYEDLVQHYHTFLRSRIPRILGTAGPLEELRTSVGGNYGGASTMSHPHSHSDGHAPALPYRVDEPRPGPSSRLLASDTEMMHQQLPQPLLNLANNPLFRPAVLPPQSSLVHRMFGLPQPPMDPPSLPNFNSMPFSHSPASASTTTQSQGSSSNSANATAREFGSIEALAQNIMEMQNLCR